ncbi:SGNH/GDSL hydrolase family protein [Zeaxanthinibacter sp. PT1]|uniref:SGNH/GDSL hydrolase family protein n=1 Tax=Zeaxanthinibacter TaxID=561554 RepID=UPI00234B27C2|nr:SGNH/GDSL hydrolase family protein [Zeaxanthinibacter sp. PT1]MDC6351628.1 SGNH/GDSL hydrolase family protein [Zeaxanthinibacter sp. PT1]
MKLYLLIAILICSLSTMETMQAQDWAQLDHFREANMDLEAAKDYENRVVFMGNSITIGWLHAMPEFFENNPYINRGIGGQTTPQMLVRFRQDVIDLQPKVVVILAGTNDIAGNTGPSSLKMIMDNIASMAELARANNIAVVLSSVLPAEEYPWKKGMKPNEKIPALNTMISEYARENNFIYLDYFRALANSANGMDKTLATDGVHPTRAGYQIMAPLAKSAIKKALSQE